MKRKPIYRAVRETLDGGPGSGPQGGGANEASILYEKEGFYVVRQQFGKTSGFAVFENGAVAAKRVASIGYSGDKGLQRAKEEVDKRVAAKKGGK